MDISRKTDYALRMIARLVESPDATLSVRSAAQESGVPYSFARSIQHDLATAGLVTNVRGANGGMRLAVDPRETTLLDVVRAVQGPVVFGCCRTAGAGGAPCPNRADCRYTSVWCQGERLLEGLFGSVTLHQLIAERRTPVPHATFELVPEGESRRAAEDARR